jgi:hypothetical protein
METNDEADTVAYRLSDGTIYRKARRGEHNQRPQTGGVLTTSQVAELLGMSGDAGYRRVYNAIHRLGLTEWTASNVRKLQVAAALAEACAQPGFRQASPFPELARAVFANIREPEPGSWAVYKESAVSYVLYRADLAGAVGKGAVVAEIDRLWPETGEPDDD